MLDKKALLYEIKELWSGQNVDSFDIDPKLLEYLDIEDLKSLKRKILESMQNLSDEQKEWLSKFRRY